MRDTSPPRRFQFSGPPKSRYHPGMPNVGPLEIAGLLLLALLLFGAKRLPEIGRSLGSGMREFKDSIGGKSHDEPKDEPTELAAVPVAPPSEPAVTAAVPRDHDSAP